MLEGIKIKENPEPPSFPLNCRRQLILVNSYDFPQTVYNEHIMSTEKLSANLVLQLFSHIYHFTHHAISVKEVNGEC